MMNPADIYTCLQDSSLKVTEKLKRNAG